MNLIEKNNIKSHQKKLERIYINTLIPCFNFKNKKGSVIASKNYCIAL